MHSQQPAVHTVCVIIVCPLGVLINARRMRTRVTVLCLSVCVSVCYQSTMRLTRLCRKMIIPVSFSPSFKGFQLRDFAIKLSFTSSSSFSDGLLKSAIFKFCGHVEHVHSI